TKSKRDGVQTCALPIYTGNVTLTNIQVTDPRIGGNIGMVHELAPSADSVLSFTYTLTQKDIDSGGVHNIAYGEGRDPNGDPVREIGRASWRERVDVTQV